jgi:signal transduction histidine kinase
MRLKRSYAEIEKIVEERTLQLKVANQELAHSEKMRSLGTLAAGVAHDFNSILSIIRGSVQIIEANPDNREKIRTRVDRIKSMVEQGSTLVKSMLGFSRADDAGLALNDVDDVVEGAADLLGDRLPEEISIRVDASRNLPPVRGNRELLQQIIVNLVLNAVDAMDGKGTLVLRCHHAHQLPDNWVLQPSDARDYVAVTVEDNGCGITAENLSRIFEPFFTTKAFSTRHGTGLGLSMVYEFCKELGYGLNVRSELNRGTSFNIIIPVLEKKTDKKSPALS